MAHDPGRWRFFAYLNLFMFSMLLLVLADNYLVLFAAWELVGLSSYLLIGFWYTRRAPALASKKAFLVNRVGDLGFLIGIIGVFLITGTLNIQASFGPFGEADPLVRNIVALLLFVGAAGKSAQFPLHVWLPDAMEGPTPVCALIHAATMVNAGVYFVARTSPLFAQAPEALIIVASIGIFTAILAASIALTQTDIKRVLAYSTLSQLGYMFAALGVGAFVAAIFHLMAHGFFKGLLFLGSGSVIHAVHDEQDMNRMGGLWRSIPITHWTMLIGAYRSPASRRWRASSPRTRSWARRSCSASSGSALIGVVVAGMTGFYMFRLMGKTFYGESHVDPRSSRTSTSRRSNDGAAHPAGHPDDPPRARHRPPAGRFADPALARARLPPGRGDAAHRAPRVRALRASTARSSSSRSPSPRSASASASGCSASSAARASPRPSDD